MSFSSKTISHKNESGTTIAVLLITLLAAVLRLPSMGVPMEADEADSFMVTGLFPWRKLLFTYLDTTSVFYIALSRIAMSVFGEGEIAFRLPSLLAGVLAVPLLYWLGLRLMNSRPAAIVAAFLLALSFPHTFYSQYSKGHAVTVFLALLMMASAVEWTKIKRQNPWGVFLPFLGLSLALTLPSNGHFIAAVCVYFTVETLRNQKRSGFSVRLLFTDMLPLILMVAVVFTYYVLIYADLKRVMGLYQEYLKTAGDVSVERIAPGRFLTLLEFLVSPWGLWLCIVAVYGCICLWLEEKLLPFLIIFVVPVILIFATGLMGPPRTYIYWIPFVLMPVAFGAVRLASILKKWLPDKVFISICVIVGVAMIINPTLELMEYYPKRLKAEGTSMADAQKALTYIRSIPKNHLVVIFYKDFVLRHYVEEEVAHNMFGILKGIPLEGMVFIGHKSLPPQDMPAGINPLASPLKESMFKKSLEIGDLRVYEFLINIDRLAPPTYDPDYMERIFAPGNNEDTRLEHIALPRIVGESAILLQKNKDKDSHVLTPFRKKVILNNDGYLLYLYASRYKQRSLVTMADIETGMDGITTEYKENEDGTYNKITRLNGVVTSVEKAAEGFPLNYYFGLFQSTGSGFQWKQVHPNTSYIDNHLYVDQGRAGASDLLWQILFILSPISKGSHDLAETIYLQDQIGFFDGLQTYFVSMKDTVSRDGEPNDSRN